MSMMDALNRSRRRGSQQVSHIRASGALDVQSQVQSIVSGSSKNKFINLKDKGRENAREQYDHNTGWVFSSIRIIAQRIARQPLRLGKFVKKESSASSGVPIYKQYRKAQLPKNLKHMQSELELVEQHDLIDTINDPNPIMVRWSLMYVTVASLELTGKCFWWIKKGEPGSGRKWEIWHIPSHWVTPKHSDDNVFVGWIVRPPNMTKGIEVPAEEMAYFYYPDPSDPLGVLSPLQAQARAVITDEFIVEAQRRGFMNSIWPGMAVIIGKMPNAGSGSSNIAGANTRITLGKKQRQTLLAAIKNAYRGIYRTDEPIILDGLVEDIKKITNTNREMDFLTSSKLTKSRVTQGFGVNPVSMGEIEGVNRAIAQAADKHLCDNTVNPKIELISECLTAWVVPLFEGGKTGLVAFLEECEAEDPEMDLKRAESGVKNAAMTINEFRVNLLNLPPVHGGDVVLVNGTLKPVSLIRTDEPLPDDVGRFPGETGEDDDEDDEPLDEPDDEPDDDPDEEPEEDDGDREAAAWSLQDFRGPERYTPFSSKLSHEASTIVFEKNLTAQEQHVQDVTGSFFRGTFRRAYKEASRLLHDSELISGDQVASIIDASWDKSFRETIKIAFKPVVNQGAATEFFLNAPRTRQQVARFKVSPLIAKGEQCPADPLPPGTVQNVLTEMPDDVKEEINRFTNDLAKQPYWQDQGPAVRSVIRNTVNSALKSGASNHEMLTMINNALGGEAKARAARIARTETTGALNAGADMTRNKLAAQGLVTGKEWNAALDNVTRQNHSAAHGQKVRQKELFTIGHQSAKYPGDQSLTANERANCRCTAISITIAEDPAMLGPEASDRDIAQALFINEAQALGFVNATTETTKHMLGFPANESKIRSFIGAVLKKSKGSTTAKRLGSMTKYVKSKVSCNAVYRALNWWWSSEGMTAKVLRSPIKGYLAGLNKLVSLAGAGLPASVRVAGYWTGLGASYVLTPYAPWLTIPGASDGFAIGSLLGMQVLYRGFMMTRWVGRRVGVNRLAKIVSNGLRTAKPKGTVAMAKNAASVFEKLVKHNNPSAGNVEMWEELNRNASRLLAQARGGG